MFHDEEQSKTKQNLVKPQGDDSSENQQKEIVNVTPDQLYQLPPVRLFFPVLLDDGLAYQILDMQVAEKEVRGSPTHKQPKQCFCINQNQCILLLWSRLIRRIKLSTGLISFQWIVHHLFVNTYMYLLDNNFICWIALSTL